MTWRQLTEQCLDSIAHPERSPSTGPALVLQSPSRGGLFPKGGGPRGKCVGSDSRGYFLWYDANKVLAALVVRGIVKYTDTPEVHKFEVVAEVSHAS